MWEFSFISSYYSSYDYHSMISNLFSKKHAVTYQFNWYFAEQPKCKSQKYWIISLAQKCFEQSIRFCIIVINFEFVFFLTKIKRRMDLLHNIICFLIQLVIFPRTITSLNIDDLQLNLNFLKKFTSHRIFVRLELILGFFPRTTIEKKSNQFTRKVSKFTI